VAFYYCIPIILRVKVRYKLVDNKDVTFLLLYMDYTERRGKVYIVCIRNVNGKI